MDVEGNKGMEEVGKKIKEVTGVIKVYYICMYENNESSLVSIVIYAKKKIAHSIS
jgi:hypothetical protein